MILVYCAVHSFLINFVMFIMSYLSLIFNFFYYLGVSTKTKFLLIGKAFLVLLGIFTAASLGIAFISKVLDVFGATMSWYRSPYLVFGLYGCSSLAIIISCHWYLAQKIKVRYPSMLLNFWFNKKYAVLLFIYFKE